MSMVHTPVLLHETIEGLQVQKGDVVLDATVGGGGHSEALCRAAEGAATFICLDADEDAIERSRKRLAGCSCRFLFFRMNFRYLDAALASCGIAKVNKVLFDLGLSSQQLDESGRGFSFRGSEPLAMTFAKDAGPDALTAETIVNGWDEENIATIIGSYGEDRAAKRIAKAIVRARVLRPIRTTAELRELIERILPRRGKLHPATKTFQALRMAANDELGALSEALPKAWSALAAKGRIAAISFHSLEDRIVKKYFREHSKGGTGALITKKPIYPSPEEVCANPRARSAKIRIIEKL